MKEALEQRLVGLLFPLQDFGTLSEYLAQQILTDDLMDSLSPHAREGAFRALATMMVLAQNYHPNMLVLRKPPINPSSHRVQNGRFF